MQTKRYENKVVLITASSTGIGLSMVTRFAQEGAHVVVSSRNQHHIDDAVNGLKKQGLSAVGKLCHAGKKEHLEALVKFTTDLYGKIDVLVCNVAVSTHVGDILDITQVQMQKMYEINIMSTITLCQLAIPHMYNQKGANIMIISSVGGYQMSAQPIPFYSLTKTFLFGLTKVLAKQLQNDKIRVNCIAPGIIKTKFSSGLWEADEKAAIQSQGLNRLGNVEDISNAAAYMCSHEADYITGEVLTVAGYTNPRL